MYEHLIRLRSGWTGWWADGPRRVDLPVTWGPERPPPVRLERSFHALMTDGGWDCLRLRLDTVPGVVCVRFNGQDLGPPHSGGKRVEWLVAPWLQQSNLLELELMPDWGRGSRPSYPALWGHVELVLPSELAPTEMVGERTVPLL